MNFIETKIKDAYVLELERLEDERGFFARIFCHEEFEKQGLSTDLVQCSISFNKKKGTLRGMHYQAKPFSETKVVRCVRGSAYDVILDLRPGSPSYKEWVAIELSEKNYRMIYVPEGCAHGFQTLEDNTEIFYQMSEYYHPECAAGVRWDDPAFNIQWPAKENMIISERDASYRNFD